MSWTDERVARLTKLWADGLSASQVAADLGGITRNAVIGKVHRLGLSGRAKPASKGGGRPKRTARANTYSRTTRAAAKSSKGSNVTVFTKTPAHSAALTEDLVAPEPKRLSLVQLTETTCKWPIGDPQEDDFCFCGHDIKAETPYCKYHCKLAYQPVAERRRIRRA